MVCVQNIGIFVNKEHAYFFFKIIAINIFKVNNFHFANRNFTRKICNLEKTGI